MSHLMPGYPGAEQNIKKFTDLVGSNKITDQMGEEEKEHDRYEIFEAICVLKDAARELYCDGDMAWDEMVTELADAIKKLKGKEADLKKIDEESESADEAGTEAG